MLTVSYRATLLNDATIVRVITDVEIITADNLSLQIQRENAADIITIPLAKLITITTSAPRPARRRRSHK